jgi:hypothetical protein
VRARAALGASREETTSPTRVPAGTTSTMWNKKKKSLFMFLFLAGRRSAHTILQLANQKRALAGPRRGWRGEA